MDGLSRISIGVAVAIVVGVVARLCGYFDSDLQLWLDEAMWAEFLAEDRVGWIRPPGYMALTGIVTSVFGNNEATLRSLSLLTGLATLPMMWLALRRLVVHPAALFFGMWLVAIHPALVEMSKEFKPYGLEASLHASLLCCALMYLSTSRRGWLIAMGVVSVVAPFFAWTVIFLYPAVFGVCGIRAIRERRRIDIGIGAVSMLITLALLGVVFAMRVSGRTGNAGFWGKKYGVFYMGDSVVGKLGWVASKTYDVSSWTAQLDVTGPLEAALTPLAITFTVLIVAGVAVLVRERRIEHAILVVTPWLLTILFNVTGKWPYGVFRTNVFLVVYGIVLIAIAVDALTRATSTMPLVARRALIACGLVVFLVTVPFDPRGFFHKEASHVAYATSVRTAMEQIAASEPRTGDAPQELVLLDGHACTIWRYYAELHEDTKQTLGPALKQRFRTECSGVALKKWTTLLHANVANARFAVSAKTTAATITSRVAKARCANAIETALPYGTFVVECR